MRFKVRSIGDNEQYKFENAVVDYHDNNAQIYKESSYDKATLVLNNCNISFGEGIDIAISGYVAIGTNPYIYQHIILECIVIK